MKKRFTKNMKEILKEVSPFNRKIILFMLYDDSDSNKKLEEYFNKCWKERKDG